MLARLFLRLSGAVCLAVLPTAVACNTAMNAKDAESDPAHPGAPPKAVVVFGTGLDETDRRTVEDAFVTALLAHGVRATPSYKLFPGTLPSGKEARATLQQAAIDGALVSNLRVLTGKMTSVDVEKVPQFWSVLQSPGWGAVYDPDRAADGSVVRIETSLWDLHAAKVVWSASTRTDKPSPSLAKDFVSTVTKELVPEMVKAGALPPPISSTEVSYSPLLLHSK
jgi:hypothetical protein